MTERSKIIINVLTEKELTDDELFHLFTHLKNSCDTYMPTESSNLAGATLVFGAYKHAFGRLLEVTL
jgi:hypothetical protein